MTATTSTPSALLKAARDRLIAEQHKRDEAVAAETRKLAELVAKLTRGDDRISLQAAADAMGTSKGYAHGLVKKLDAGDL